MFTVGRLTKAERTLSLGAPGRWGGRNQALFFKWTGVSKRQENRPLALRGARAPEIRLYSSSGQVVQKRHENWPVASRGAGAAERTF